MSKQLTFGGAVIAKALTAEDVTDVFGVTGSHVVDIFEALYAERTIRTIAAKHAGGAAFMAAAYAQLSGKTGVCVTTAGPGVLNAMNGLAQAQFSALPVVCISGGVPVGAASFDLHGLRQEHYCADAVKPVVKESIRVLSIATLSKDVARAFQISRSQRSGPVYLEIPWDLFQESSGKRSTAYTHLDPEPARFGTDNIPRIVEQLYIARSPVIVLDKGVRGIDASAAIMEIATRLDCGIVVTRDVLGVIPDVHPCYAGVLHDHQFGPFAFDTIKSADCCVAIGFDSGSRNSQVLDSVFTGDVIQIGLQDSQAETGGKLVELHELIAAMSDTLSEKRNRTVGTATLASVRRDSVAQMIAGLQEYDDQIPIHFGYALTVLVSQLADDTITLLDAGSHEVWTRSILPARNEQSLIGGNDWASMGFAIPAAVGARRAMPSRRLVCVTGDGCLLMSMADLSTLIEAGGPTLIINLNDSEYGMMSQVQRSKYGCANGTSLPKIDYASVASEFGADSIRVEKPGDLDRAFAKALASNSPFFIDLICDSGAGYPVYGSRMS